MFICVLAYLFTLSTFVAFIYVFALLQLTWKFSAADTPRWRHIACKLVINCTTRYDTIVVFKVDSKAEQHTWPDTKTNISVPIIQYRLRSMNAVRKE